MEKIENLTDKQEAQLEEYYQKWLKIGLEARVTTPEMRKKAEDAIKRIYAIEGLAEPKKIIWTRSPMEGARKCVEMGDSKDNLQYACGYGSHDANWLGFYDFMLTELKIKECEELIPTMDLAKLAGWWWPYENACIVSELPIECHVNEEGNLHHDGGASIEYSDGFAMYHLNGIEVSKEIAEIPKEKVSKDLILKEENADIRRELLRKVGIENAIEILGAKTVDMLKSYELLEIDFDGKAKRPYLKMKNPSLGLIHIEGVMPRISSVRDAIIYRNGLVNYMEPENLS